MSNWHGQHSSYAGFTRVPAITSDDLEILKNYWNFIHNFDEKRDMAELMAKDIVLQRPDTLYIKSFGILNEISHLDYTSYLKKIVQEKLDPRYCHMNNQNNIILASKINDWLNGNIFKCALEDFKEITSDEIELYYEYYKK
jgi:hypothetical protein